jgi:hypothetical protein
MNHLDPDQTGTSRFLSFDPILAGGMWSTTYKDWAIVDIKHQKYRKYV